METTVSLHIITKLTYAATDWWGYTSAADRHGVSSPTLKANWSMLKRRANSNRTIVDRADYKSLNDAPYSNIK